MPELGLSILILGILIAADRQRLRWATDKVRDFLEWLERSSA